MVAFRWMVLLFLLMMGSGCVGEGSAPATPEGTALLPTSTPFMATTPAMSVAEVAASTPAFDPASYPPPVLEPPPPTPYPPHYTWEPATPTPTREPISVTAALPLEWTWFYEHDQNRPAGRCGWSLYARSTSGESLQLTTQLMTFLPREHSTPLLILCDGADPVEVRLVDFTTGMSLALQADPARFHYYNQAVLSPDGTRIAFQGEGHDPDNPRAPTYPPPFFWGILVIDVATGEISELLEFPPYEPGGVGWDSYFLLEWRADGLYYGSQASGATRGWKATWPPGAVPPYRVVDGTLTVEPVEGLPSGFNLIPTPGGLYDPSIPQTFVSPRVIYRPAP